MMNTQPITWITQKKFSLDVNLSDPGCINMKRLTLNSDISDLINAFEQDREATLKEIYLTYRSSFLEYSKRMSDDQELMIDCFQEAIISLYENLAIGKVTNQKSTIKTYLYAIGKNKILNATKKKRNQAKLVLIQAEKVASQSTFEDKESQKVLISKAFDKLGERCKSILTRFYYERYSIEAIMLDMNYKNENTVKAHKSRCIRNMKDIILTLKNDQ